MKNTEDIEKLLKEKIEIERKIEEARKIEADSFQSLERIKKLKMLIGSTHKIIQYERENNPLISKMLNVYRFECGFWNFPVSLKFVKIDDENGNINFIYSLEDYKIISHNNLSDVEIKVLEKVINSFLGK